MRAFFCIPIDETIRREIAAVAGTLREGTATRAVWVPPDNYHITLRFLGEIDPMLTVELERIAREIAEKMGAFPFTIDRLGAFPTVERPRVIWVGGTATPEFTALSSTLDRSLERLGFPRKREERVVHITIARTKGMADPGLIEGIRSTGIPSNRISVERMILMESRLTPRGAVYSPLFSIPLTEDG